VKSHLNLSRVLLEQGKAQEALPHVTAALKIDSTSSEAFRLLGRVKGELGDPDGAITAYRQSIVLDPRDAWSMNNIARVYIGQGRFADALGPLARAVEVDSTVAVFHNNLGLALERSGNVVQAADAYRAALAIDSTDGKAQNGLTRVRGLSQSPSVAPVDLGGLAGRFVQETASWRRAAPTQ
jgi:Flp pilus assembly protein TadD